MKDLQDKVAVVTGAASGIGRALAEKSAQEGMQVVLADVEENALAQTEQEMKAAGATVLAVRTDVSKASDVEALAQKTLAAFGGVHLLFNNAGVCVFTTVWESSLRDWEWVLGVNLWGVIHGLRSFVPIMLKQDTEGHIVNTASIAGLASVPGMPLYAVSKHAIVALSEMLHHDLARIGSKIHVSVLCPVWVNTRMIDSARNRPAELQNDPSEMKPYPGYDAYVAWVRKSTETGMPAPQAADCVFDAIRGEKFYILTHPVQRLVQMRMEDILQGRNPRNPLA